MNDAANIQSHRLFKCFVSYKEYKDHQTENSDFSLPWHDSEERKLILDSELECVPFSAINSGF